VPGAPAVLHGRVARRGSHRAAWLERWGSRPG